MSATSQIHYTRHEQLDKVKWDACISNADNGLVYAYSFYLDHMARNWDALILGDYEKVMPLPWNKKYGIRYIHQPFLAAQLGIFGKDLNAVVTRQFIESIPSHFKYLDISLNNGNLFSLDGINFYERTNYVLPLHARYEQLYEAYRDNVRRNVKKAIQVGCTVKKDFVVDEVIQLAVQQMRDYSLEPATNVEHFRELYKLLYSEKMAMTYGIANDKNELVASCVFFYSHKRAYYILVGNHPNGKTIGASHALIDAFIKDHAGSDITLDFEGSDLRNLAFFYSSFGAHEEKYPHLIWNRLPFYLKWLKRS